MSPLITKLTKFYSLEIAFLDRVKDVFLLVVRVYFGLGFISAGTGKLSNVSTHVGFFTDYGIPFPTLNVYMAGFTETVCGFLLAVGAGSRIITIPLIVTMLVAFATAHTEQLHAFWGNTPIFFKAPPFPYLYTALIVLLVGPGLLSADALVGWLIRKESIAPDPTEAAAHGSTSDPVLS